MQPLRQTHVGRSSSLPTKLSNNGICSVKPDMLSNDGIFSVKLLRLIGSERVSPKRENGCAVFALCGWQYGV
jgi:hypothetical protein